MVSSKTILVVDDEPLMREFLQEALSEEGYKVLTAESASEALDGFQESNPDCLMLDIRLPDRSGLDVLKDIREIDSRIPVIMMTAYGEMEDVIEALREMADDFLPKPFEVPEVIQTLDGVLRDRKEPDGSEALNVVYQSDAMETILDKARKYAQEDDPVLIRGESGVGKEVIARYIHYQSPRVEGPLMAVNCGAIPGNLMESELFGHQEGAFTGAEYSREGLFQAADGGCLFLDEVGELSVDFQPKLLRALESNRVKPVGSDKYVDVNTRILAATNQDLEEMIDTNAFREDLYYRLNVFSLEIPPVRDRPEDIPILITHYLRRNNYEYSISDELIDELKDYDWPGNVREIQTFVRRLTTQIEGNEITRQDVESTGLFDQPESEPVAAISGNDFPPEPDLETVLEGLRKQFINEALDRSDGNRTAAADLLGMNRTTLVETMKRLDIDRDDGEEP